MSRKRTSAVVETPPAGSVAEIVANLAAWCAHAPSGLACVVYDSEFSRQRVVDELRERLEGEGIPFQEIALPVRQPAWDVLSGLIEWLGRIETGVVSISGWATAFPGDVPLPESLGALNFRRERLAGFPLRQIWWMTRSFAEAFVRAAPDTNSWFLVRLDLTEITLPPREDYLRIEPSETPHIPLEEARRRAADLVERFKTAAEHGATSLELLTLATSAGSALTEAGAILEAQHVMDDLGRKIAEGLGVPPNDKTLAQIALQIGSLEGSAMNLEVGNILHTLAHCYHYQARYFEAESLYNLVLNIAQKVLGEEHPNTATTINNLGSVLRARGELEGAKKAFERALKIDEATFGPEHPNTATTVNNLGSVLRALGDLSGAKAAHERALKIDEQTFGKEHPKVAIRINNLGSVLQDLGDLEGAQAAFERALKIDEQAFGKEHPDVARDVNNLGGVLVEQGDLLGARRAYERALQISRRFLGDDHPNTRIAMENLRWLREDIGHGASACRF